MNCFAHAYPFLNRDPYFVVGTALPDWLSLVDRKVRVRKKRAVEFVDNEDGSLRALACGVVQHHDDDDWFHRTRTFVELNLSFSQELRELLGADGGFRPHLVGHILIEMLLDSFLTEQDISKLDRFYNMVRQIDPARVQTMTNAIAVTKTNKIGAFIPRFIAEGYLYDYMKNHLIRYRMNRILGRIKLALLPRSFLDWLPSARHRVYINADGLLELREIHPDAD